LIDISSITWDCTTLPQCRDGALQRPACGARVAETFVLRSSRAPRDGCARPWRAVLAGVSHGSIVPVSLRMSLAGKIGGCLPGHSV